MPTAKRINISLTPELMDGLHAYALREDRGISWVIRQALSEYLTKHGPGMGKMDGYPTSPTTKGGSRDTR